MLVKLNRKYTENGHENYFRRFTRHFLKENLCAYEKVFEPRFIQFI